MELIKESDFTRVSNDTYGNPRFVAHYLSCRHPDDESLNVSGQYAVTLYRMRKLGGRKFHNRQYGGGIAWATHDLPRVVAAINAARGIK